MSLQAKKKKAHRSKSLSPGSVELHNTRTCKFRHSNKRIDTSSSSLSSCSDCKLKIKRFGSLFGCTRCKFYLCRTCISKPSCNKGHILNLHHVNKSTTCSLCSYKSKKNKLSMYQCNICKYNMCLGCYSFETCSGNHGLKYLKITEKMANNKKSKLNYCHKCQRIFKINKSLFICKKCKYALCKDCYSPSLSLKNKILKQQSIRAKIKENLPQIQQNQILYNNNNEEKKNDNNDIENKLNLTDDENDNDNIHENENEDEEKMVILTDDTIANHNRNYNNDSYNNFNSNNNIDHDHEYNHSNSFNSRSHSNSLSQSQSISGNGGSMNANAGTPQRNKKNNNNKKKDKKKIKKNHHNNDLDLASMSFTPSELTRIPSILTDCCICMERDKEVAFLPCGHYISCQKCAKSLQKETGQCAICMTKIQSIIKIFE